MVSYRYEWKENFGMEYGRSSEWNGMEDLKNGMEDYLPYSLVTTYTVPVYIKTCNKLQSTVLV